MSISLPDEVSFHPSPRLMVYRPRGILTEDRVLSIIKFLEKAEDKSVTPFNRFTDLSKLDALDLDFKAMIRISLHRRLFYAHHPAVKSAFYVTSPAAARVVRIHVILTDHSPLQVKMFQKLDAVARWLDVPRRLLEFHGTSRHNGGPG